MKARNYIVYGTEAKLRFLEEEYSMIGRETRRDQDKLVVFALPQKKEEPKKKYQKKNYRSQDRG